MRRYITATVLLSVSMSASAQVSVGWGSDCDYDIDTDPQGLQTALDDGASEIRLTNQNAYDGSIDIAQSVTLRGGFADCSAAESDNQTNMRSVLDGLDQNDTVVQIRDIDNADIRLELLTVRNGDGLPNNAPGGIEVKGLTGQVVLDQLYIHDNVGLRGGGLSTESNFSDEDGLLDVFVTATTIRGNISGTTGGGVQCRVFDGDFELRLHMSQGVTIRENHADSAYGGISLVGCHLEYEAGIAGSEAGSNPDEEIFRNTSQTSGAGMGLFGSASATLTGTSDQAFDLSLNEGNLDEDTSGYGGAAQVGDGSTLEIINGNISGNSIGRYGGALFASRQGRIIVRPDPAGCSYDQYCSRIVNNRMFRARPGGGGALAARFGGVIEVYNTFFWLNNSDDRGYIAYLEQDDNGMPSRLLLEGNVILENGRSVDDSNSNAFELGDNSESIIAYNSFARNRSDRTLFDQSSDSSLEALGNIIQEFGNIHEAQSGAEATINCNLVRSIETIEVPTTDSIEGLVSFVDLDSRDLRLAQADILAMDVCSSQLYEPGNDIDGRSRGLDRLDVPDLRGPFDLGAFEFDPDQADRIFSDSFLQ